MCFTGASSTLKSFWSPKTVREDVQQYFQSESKMQPISDLMLNHSYSESYNKSQGQPMKREAEELYQRLNDLDTDEQWLFSQYNEGIATYSPPIQEVPKPPGLQMPSVGSTYLSKMAQSKLEYNAIEKVAGLGAAVNSFSDHNNAFSHQSKINGQCHDQYYEDYLDHRSVKTKRAKHYAPQDVNKFVSDFQALMAGEQDTYSREPQNRQTVQMQFEENMADQRKFISPRMSAHNTLTMQNQKELCGEFGVQRESDGGVRKQSFQSDYGAKDPLAYCQQHKDCFPQPKPFGASFNSPSSYQNKVTAHKANPSLSMNSLNQYSQHHSQQSQLKQSWANCLSSAPSKMLSHTMSEFVPQQSHQIQRGPPCMQDYNQGDGPAFHSRLAQSQMGATLDGLRRGEGDFDMLLDKTRMQMAGLLGEGFSTQCSEGNTRPQVSPHMRESDKKQGLLQNPYLDLLGSMYGAPRFGGANASASAGKTPQFLPFMYQANDPRQSSCHLPMGSSSFNSRSSLPYGNTAPLMDLGDLLPESEFTPFNPYLGDTVGSGGEGLYPGMASVLRSPRMMRSRGGPLSQLHFHLEECYEHWRSLEKERKKTEVILTKTYPGKRVSVVTSNALPKVPPNPSRVDRLIVDQIREQAKVVSLLGKMERLRSVPLHANICSKLDRHLDAIYITQARRKEEFANRQRQGSANFREDRDIMLLVTALKDLCATTRKSRTALWCALQMTLPKSSEKLDECADSEGTSGESSPGRGLLPFQSLMM
ncbi:meiosis-specific coiled-coil domain-containing protein MEIOC [Aplochiton taeniatus]